MNRRSQTHRDDDHAAYGIRARPPRRGSRPRTKDRPSHDQAVAALVTGVDRGRYALECVDGTCATAMRARELGRKSIVVGDRVDVVGDTTGAPGTLARIVRIQDRRNVLRRTADDGDHIERLLVANVDIMVVVTAAADPEPSLGLIDRCLVAAHDAGVRAVVCVTKTDLQDPNPLLERLQAAHAEVVLTATLDGQRGVPELAELLADHCSVLLGHSGVGKSTLVNALVPQADRSTGAVNTVTGRGRHTSSSAVMFPLPGGGYVIDTPGVRSFGVAHVDDLTVVASFTELAGGVDQCPRSCTHIEPECALDAHAEALGPFALDRLESLRKLLTSRTDPDYGRGSALRTNSSPSR